MRSTGVNQQRGGLLRERSAVPTGILLFASLFSFLGRGESADSLFGVAAIVGASTPAVVSGIQASADQRNAQTNAALAQYQSGLDAYSQSLQIGANSTIAMGNTLASLRIASMNTQKELMMAAMTTAAQMHANDQSFYLKKQQLDQDSYFQSVNMALKAQLAQAQIDLQRLQLSQTSWAANNPSPSIGGNGGSWLSQSSPGAPSSWWSPQTNLSPLYSSAVSGSRPSGLLMRGLASNPPLFVGRASVIASSAIRRAEFPTLAQGSQPRFHRRTGDITRFLAGQPTAAPSSEGLAWHHSPTNHPELSSLVHR